MPSRTESEQTAWEEGFAAGESDILADWDFALSELLPEDVPVRPGAVADYIKKLQSSN